MVRSVNIVHGRLFAFPLVSLLPLVPAVRLVFAAVLTALRLALSATAVPCLAYKTQTQLVNGRT